MRALVTEERGWESRHMLAGDTHPQQWLLGDGSARVTNSARGARERRGQAGE